LAPAGGSLSSIVAVYAAKTIYYFMKRCAISSMRPQATWPTTAFALIAYNMSQITLSYAIDFYCLFDRPPNISGIDLDLPGAALMFECFYFSVLNFVLRLWRHHPSPCKMQNSDVARSRHCVFDRDLLVRFREHEESMRKKK
jgi:hypothetical protein